MAPPEMSVHEAAMLMADNQFSAVMVVDEERLVGIFTERDAVFRVIAANRDTHTTPLAYVMTPNPTTVSPDETFGYALLLMHEQGFRHMPVIENGRPIGIVSARDALDPDLEEFSSEMHRRTGIRRAAGPA
jgi:CBS domain-containing protein